MHKLTSYHLKIIAIITMVLDHALKIFTNDIINAMQANHMFTMPTYIIFMMILAIGRISFPLFAYMISEGCHYTHNIKKYISRLIILGIISEIPFQYMFAVIQEQPYHFGFSLGNVFFTLAFGAMAIEGYRYVKEKFTIPWLSCLPVIACAGLAQAFNTDYAAPGVILIFLWSYYRETKHWYFPALIFSFFLYSVYMFTLGIVHLGFDWLILLEAILHTSCSCLSLFFIYNYNQQRGKPLKWFFYIFYPLHITVLVLLYFLIH